MPTTTTARHSEDALKGPQGRLVEAELGQEEAREVFRVAAEPSMISAGLPGEMCSNMKMMTDTPASTGSNRRSRRVRARLTYRWASSPLRKSCS